MHMQIHKPKIVNGHPYEDLLLHVEVNSSHVGHGHASLNEFKQKAAVIFLTTSR